MTKPEVVKVSSNIKDAIKIDRGTRWGNPFVMGVDGNRDDVCDLYEQYAKWRLGLQPNWLDDLKGKDLACHCAPKRCNGDTLIKLANMPVILGWGYDDNIGKSIPVRFQQTEPKKGHWVKEEDWKPYKDEIC